MYIHNPPVEAVDNGNNAHDNEEKKSDVEEENVCMMRFNKRNFIVVIFVITVTVMAFVLSGCADNNSQKTFDMLESYKMTVPAGQTAWLQVDLPVSYGYQQIEALKVEGTDDWDITAHDDYQTMLCSVEGTGGEQMVSIRYTVTLPGDAESWQLPQHDEYLLPGEFVDSDNADIQAAAQSLIVESNDYETAKNIHRFVTETVKPRAGSSVNQMTMKASEVLKARVGVCGDYAHLMTAMLRAVGIPARDVAGNAMNNLRKSGDWQHPGDAHAWVEFYADGAWHFADPTWGNDTFDNPDNSHLSYGMAVSDINSQEAADLYKGITDQGYFIFGGMTAPLHFTAWCTGEGAAITPGAQVVE